MQAAVQDITRAVVQRPADGNGIVGALRINFVVGGVHREFRRPIGIVNPAFRLRDAGHGFAAQTHVIHVQGCILPKKLSELCGVAATGDAARRQIFAHRKHILPDFLRNDE